MQIGEAVTAMQNDQLVARAGWNGKGMFLFLNRNEGATTEYEVGGRILEAEEQNWVAMKTAQGTVVPWLCSQSDLLADDWEVVPIK